MTSRAVKALKWGGGLAVLGAAGFLALTSPWTWSALHGRQSLPPLQGADLENGRQVFVSADCATCHATPGRGEDTALGGGRALDTLFGVFHMPNISPDKAHGIGNWSLAQFDRALREGVGPGGWLGDGQNLYPAFPYTSYQRLTGSDVRDLFAYLMTLPPQGDVVKAHELKFPYNIRRGVGVWRLAFLNGKPFTPAPVPSGADADIYHRGQYLVQAAGHCAECHSSRGFMGNIIASERYGGGPNPEGTGWFPNISPDETGIGYWAQASIANYLKTGVNPIGQPAAGDMAEVVENTRQLPFKDLQAIALYLKNVPPVHHLAPHQPEPNYSPTLVKLENVTQLAPRLPTSPETEIAQDAVLTVVDTKNSWLSAANVDGQAAPDGKLLGGAAVHVDQRDGNTLGVSLKGWQLDGADSVVYQAMGKRVMMAVLSDDAAKTVQRGTAETDVDTGQTWYPVDVKLWTDAGGLNTDRRAVWSYGQQTFQQSCGVCHALPQQGHYTANQWIGTLKAMRRFTSFSDDQYRLILAYLQNHSKDLHPDAGASNGAH